MPLFEVAILEITPGKAKEDQPKEKLVFGPEPVTAKTAQAAGNICILRYHDELKDCDPENLQVLIRPFA